MVPHLTTPILTYSVLATLVCLHLVINYMGVHTLELRTLNRQRASLAWDLYRSSGHTPSPSALCRKEHIFGRPDVLRGSTDHVIGRCRLGSSFSQVFQGHPIPTGLPELFQTERYILWYDPKSLRSSLSKPSRNDPLDLHILLKEGYTPQDQLRAWAHAAELCRLVASLRMASVHEKEEEDPLSLVCTALDTSTRAFPDFIKSMRLSGWNTNETVLMAGAPNGVLTQITSGKVNEGKKIR